MPSVLKPRSFSRRWISLTSSTVGTRSPPGNCCTKRSVAADEIAEMAERERVARRRIVGMHGAEILADQEGRAAATGTTASRGRSGRAKALPSARQTPSACHSA